MQLKKNTDAIPALVRRHVEDAAFYWSQHDASEQSPRLTLSALTRYDHLLEAHLDGIAVAGRHAWQPALAALQRWKKPGEAFVCAMVALYAQDQALLDVLAVQLAARPDELLRGAISALAWSAPARAQAVIAQWSQGTIVLQVAALRAAALINLRIDGIEAASTFPITWLAHPLQHYLTNASAHVRAAACRAAATCDLDHDLHKALGQCLDDADSRVRAQAATALLHLSPASTPLKSDAMQILMQATVEQVAVLARASGWYAKQAERRVNRLLEQLAIMLPIGDARVADLLGSVPARMGLRFVLNHGDLAHLPYVVAQMHAADSDRYAGWVWQTLTGIDLVAAGLTVPAQQDDAALDLPIPDPAAITAQQYRVASKGQRHLLGQAVTVAGSLNNLLDQPQAVRSIAARHLQVLDRDMQIAVRAPAQQQRAALAQLLTLIDTDVDINR